MKIAIYDDAAVYAWGDSIDEAIANAVNVIRPDCEWFVVNANTDDTYDGGVVDLTHYRTGGESASGAYAKARRISDELIAQIENNGRMIFDVSRDGVLVVPDSD